MSSASGKSTPVEEYAMSLVTEDPSFISAREPNALASGIILHPYRKLKAQRLRWTTAWRRLHKKLKQSDQGKNKKAKVFRKERAIEGVTLDDIKKIKQARPEDKKALAEEAVR